MGIAPPATSKKLHINALSSRTVATAAPSISPIMRIPQEKQPERNLEISASRSAMILKSFQRYTSCSCELLHTTRLDFRASIRRLTGEHRIVGAVRWNSMP
jgi:hypothetical protein